MYAETGLGSLATVPQSLATTHFETVAGEMRCAVAVAGQKYDVPVVAVAAAVASPEMTVNGGSAKLP